MDSDLKRRRETGRLHQKNYRMRQKHREAVMLERVEELKVRNVKAATYLALIAQGDLLSPGRHVDLRYLIMELGASYFEHGADAKNRLQESFLAFVSSDNLTVHDAAGMTNGYKPLLTECIRLTKLFDQIRFRSISIEMIHPEIAFQTLTVSVIVTHRSIASKWPHMLNEAVFLYKAIGKELILTIYLTVVFDSCNEIASITIQTQWVQAWLKLLKDPKLVAKVLN